MDKKINVISNIEHELEVTLGYDEIKSDIDEAYKEERKKIHLDGFRKGKVPMPILKQMYGDAIEYQASEKIANKYFWDLVEADNLKPISTPSLSDIQFEKGKHLSFKVRYEVKPKLELKDYKGLEIEKIVFDVKDEDVDKETDQILKGHATYEHAEEITDKNFRIVADLQRYDKDGNAMEGSVSNGMVIDLSDEKVNPQIAENAQNKKVNETFEFTFTDEVIAKKTGEPEDFIYKGTVKKIEKIVMPELTEEFIKKISQNKATTFEEYKAQLKENINNYYSSQSDNVYTNNLISEIVKNNEFNVPLGYVNFLLSRIVEQEKENAAKQGVKNFDEEEAKTRLLPKADFTARWQIVMENIVEAEGIKVEDADLEKLAKEEASKIGISEDKLLKYYKDSNRADSLLEEKVFEFLKENNIAKEISAEEKAKQGQEATEAAAEEKKPAKRGRKPKAEKETEAATEEKKPAKRGRKPKVEKEAEEAATEEKKSAKRGRKPKAEKEAEAAAEEKKPAKRGRKPKAEKEAEEKKED
ncbi:MAG: trigger factor [Rhodothermaceae bacterium]